MFVHVLILFLSCCVIVGGQSFTQYSACAAVAGSCTISCSSSNYVLLSLLTSDGGSTQRYFTVTASGKTYKFIVPLCGSNPTVAGAVPSFATYDAFQTFSSSTYGLGKMSLTSWLRGTYSSVNAYQVSYINGDGSGGCPGGIGRTLTIILVCNVGYTSAAPLIVQTEPTSCNYQFVVSTIDACDAPTMTPTIAPTCWPTIQPSRLPSVQPTRSPTAQPSSQPTQSPSRQPTSQPSSRPDAQPSGRPSRQPSSRPTNQPSKQPSSLPSAQPSIQLTNRPSTQPTRRPSGKPSARPSVQPSARPSGQPSKRPSEQPTSRPSSQPSIKPSNVPPSQPSSTPTRHPSSNPSSQPSGSPSSQPVAVPSAMPSKQPTERPTQQPSAQPSSQPSGKPSSQPSGNPSASPSRQPTSRPTVPPSSGPSQQPTSLPSIQPTEQPSTRPSDQPTSSPSSRPSRRPTNQPSEDPSSRPSDQPTRKPSRQPSVLPIAQPIAAPSNQPSTHPSRQPTAFPSTRPSLQPFTPPSGKPSAQPRGEPSERPSEQPSSAPSSKPTGKPSIQPSASPTNQPSDHPSSQPSKQPLSCPSLHPSGQPVSHPSTQPTSRPSDMPTNQPSSQPHTVPSSRPSRKPTSQPSRIPSSQPSAQPTARPTWSPLIRNAVKTHRPSPPPTTLTPTASPTHSLPLHTSVSVLYAEDVAVDFKIVMPHLFTDSVPSDGLSDIVLSHGTNGSSYLLLGDELISPFANHVDTNALRVIDSTVSFDRSGRSVSNAGDVNGDGFDDLIIGVPSQSLCYVLFGAEHGFVNMTEGFTILGSSGCQTGWSVGGAGDVNNDTFADVIIGAPNAALSAGGKISDAVYVIFGSRLTGLSVVDLSSLSPHQGYALHGASEGDMLGVSVSRTGDVNGDGFDDVIVGALRSTELFAGAAYVLFGVSDSSTGFQQPSNIDTLCSDNARCAVLQGDAWSWAGFSVSGAGDVNNDGLSDVLVGSVPFKTSYGAEASYLVYGAHVWNNLTVLSDMTSKQGVVITGGGVMVSGLGDINGDGFDDVMLTGGLSLSSGAAFVVTYPKDLNSSRSLSPLQSPTSPTSLPTNTAPFTDSPSLRPSLHPTQPTVTPSFAPSGPSLDPTMTPTHPTVAPSAAPSVRPSRVPTLKPSRSPSTPPSAIPSVIPSYSPPSLHPTTMPTFQPSRLPAGRPTPQPSTLSPSVSPNKLEYTEFRGHNYTNYQVISTDNSLTVWRNSSQLGYANYIVNTSAVVAFTGHNRQGSMFTVIPRPSSKLIVDSFNATQDVLNLRHFADLHSVDDLNITTNSVITTSVRTRQLRGVADSTSTEHSLTIHLNDGQSVALNMSTRGDLNADNCLFVPEPVNIQPTEKKTSQVVKITGIAFASLFVACVAYHFTSVYLRSKKRERFDTLQNRLGSSLLNPTLIQFFSGSSSDLWSSNLSSLSSFATTSSGSECEAESSGSSGGTRTESSSEKTRESSSIQTAHSSSWHQSVDWSNEAAEEIVGSVHQQSCVGRQVSRLTYRNLQTLEAEHIFSLKTGWCAPHAEQKIKLTNNNKFVMPSAHSSSSSSSSKDGNCVVSSVDYPSPTISSCGSL